MESPTTMPTMLVPSTYAGATRLVIAVFPGNPTSTDAASLRQPKLIGTSMILSSITPGQSLKGSSTLPSEASVQPNITVEQLQITRFSPATSNTIKIVSQLPSSTVCVQKYIKLRDNLKRPQKNLHWIRLAQLPLNEQLLNQISHNPVKILQQKRHPKQSQPASQQQQSARFRGSLATTTIATGVDDSSEARDAAVAGHVHGTVRGSWRG
ncbi:hypothetical protein D915_004831 [Fasciola hepatica]|uniref:Uncharacterized protein n=1 Tax=Fasciola hepatica TaxID=6192 RepID=A0A4E0RA05_FASHE|nr:hypothetical protein D915_004831 [Fasciola hepatica]